MTTPTTQTGNEGFDVYFGAVETYKLLRDRAKHNPTFLNRCLSYRLEAKNKERIKMSITLSRRVDGGQQVHAWVVLGRRVSHPSTPEDIAVYCFTRACILKESNVHEASSSQHAIFILPKISKLVMEAKSGSYYLLVIRNASGGRFCLQGKISLESLLNTLERYPNFGQGVDITTTVDLSSRNVEISCFNDKFVNVRPSQNSENTTETEQVRLSISWEELGAKEKSLYNSNSCENPSPSLGRFVGLKVGDVVFCYQYHNNNFQTDVTKDFSCPFCLVKCGSFKGLQEHLFSSHDFFNFEFWVTETYQAVNVSIRADVGAYENLGFGVDPREHVFSLGSKRRRHKLPKNQNEKHIYPLELDLPRELNALMDKANASTSMPQPYADLQCVPYVSGNDLAPTLSQLVTTRKQPVELFDPRDCPLLRIRRFFHSQRAQPMALEQVLDNYDSEDDIDNDVADFEDRRMLDDFVDVTEDEKKIMHMWNSFVRRQRVLADGHIPWACEAFSRLHQPDFVRVPNLKWLWRLFLIKLWNHGILDGRTINNCNIIINQQSQQDSD